MMSRSVLSHILPEAMVFFLENHSAEKFAEIFLGEFDTPEAIWSREMRQVRELKDRSDNGMPDFLGNT